MESGWRKGVLLFRGHDEIVVCFPDCLDQEALIRPSGNNGGSGFATSQEPFGVIEIEVSPDLLGVSGMALVTMIDQDRSNPALEKMQVFFFGG